MSYYKDRFHVLSEKISILDIYFHTLSQWQFDILHQKSLGYLSTFSFSWLLFSSIRSLFLLTINLCFIGQKQRRHHNVLLIQNNSELLLRFQRPFDIPSFENLLKVVTTILDLWCLQWCLTQQSEDFACFLQDYSQT